jgi:hypothetical protein
MNTTPKSPNYCNRATRVWMDGWMDGFRRVESSQTSARGPQSGPNVQPWKGG